MKTILLVLGGLFLFSKLQQQGTVSFGASMPPSSAGEIPYGGAAGIITALEGAIQSAIGGGGGAGYAPAAPGSGTGSGAGPNIQLFSNARISPLKLRQDKPGHTFF
jgi:hypothetical protein